MPTRTLRHGARLNSASKLKSLHSDHNGEYLSRASQSYLRSKGATQKLTVHNTPQHSGIVEQHNRTVLECVHALLHASSLPKFVGRGSKACHVVDEQDINEIGWRSDTFQGCHWE